MIVFALVIAMIVLIVSLAVIMAIRKNRQDILGKPDPSTRRDVFNHDTSRKR